MPHGIHMLASDAHLRARGDPIWVYGPKGTKVEPPVAYEGVARLLVAGRTLRLSA